MSRVTSWLARENSWQLDHKIRIRVRGYKLSVTGRLETTSGWDHARRGRFLRAQDAVSVVGIPWITLKECSFGQAIPRPAANMA